MTQTKTPKRPSLPKLSKTLKARHAATLDPDYWGKKTKYEDRDGQTVERPLVVTNKQSLNYWKEKRGLNMKRKLEDVAGLWSAYKHDEITYDQVIQYRQPLRAKRIREHNAGLETVYYVTRWDSGVEEVMFDYDNHDNIPDYDTFEAAQHINHLFADQQFIQPSTSGTGTHGYLWIEVLDDNGFRTDLEERKRWYKRCVRACRAELHDAGFQCWRKLDSLKGVAAKVSWQKSDHPFDQKNPFYLRYERGGRLAKLPRLMTAEEERCYLDRKIVTWERFCERVVALEKKHGIVAKYRQGSARDRNIVSIGTGAVSERKNRLTIDQMLMSTDKQRVALACVFRFQQLHGRHPSNGDIQALNAIYNRTPTHTGTTLTEGRIERYSRAISYSANRPIMSGGITASAPVVSENLRQMAGIDRCVTAINQKLGRAKQKPISLDDVALVFCYVRNNVVTNNGYVPRNSLLALSARERKRKKLSANAIAAIISLLAHLKIIKVAAKAKKTRPEERGICTRYELLRDMGIDAGLTALDRSGMIASNHTERRSHTLAA